MNGEWRLRVYTLIIVACFWTYMYNQFEDRKVTIHQTDGIEYVYNEGKNQNDVEYNKEKILININTATWEELQKLNRIGPKTAQKIIDYRKNKKFNKTQDIINIKGIGPKTYESIKNSIIIK